MKTKTAICVCLFVIINSLFLIHNCVSQWEPDVRLTNDPWNSYTSFNNAVCIAANGNFVHTVWFDNRDGNYEIYYKRSTNNGISWGADTRLTNNAGNSVYPSIAVSGLNVHIVWEDLRDGNDEIYYKRSTDSGINWGPDTRLTNNSAASWLPSIAISGSNVNAVWFDTRDGNWEIYYKRSTDSGINWGADTRLTNNTASSQHSSIAVYGSLVNAVWHDTRDGSWEIYYKRSTDNGINWGADTRLTNNPATSQYPSIAVSGSNVHVVWTDYRDGSWEIYYKRSIYGGINWGADTRLTNNTAYSVYPSIAVSDSLVHLVWRDERDGNEEIYYKRSTNSGITWGADTRLTNNTAYSYCSSIAVYGSIVHVVWYDARDFNYEIYYKRNPTGNVGVKNISTEIPSAFLLEQNYPNPFNPSTKIQFDVMKTENVRITVFDITGKKLEVMTNERMLPGTYEVEWNGEKYSSGIYFYRLQAGDYFETRKMILMK